MAVADEIRDRLTATFAPREIVVEDDSAAHAGHAGAPPEGESHFNVKMRTEAFAGKSRLQRHRAVHAALGADLVDRIHALALDLDA